MTPQQACDLVARRERYFALRRAPASEGFLDCDEAANVLGELLTRHGIKHRFVHGTSDEGSAHVWVRVGDLDLDPTEQGCHE